MTITKARDDAGLIRVVPMQWFGMEEFGFSSEVSSTGFSVEYGSEGKKSRLSPKVWAPASGRRSCRFQS